MLKTDKGYFLYDNGLGDKIKVRKGQLGKTATVTMTEEGGSSNKQIGIALDVEEIDAMIKALQEIKSEIAA